MRNYCLNLVGEQSADFEEVLQQSTAFISACYGIHDASSMTASRIKVKMMKTGRRVATGMPKLCSLPPTNEAFQENVKRAHYVCCTWKMALQDPPIMNPTEYGWVKDDISNSLQPTMLPPATKPAPDYILKLVRCSCSSAMPCRSKVCSCNAARIACTYFCSCQASGACRNEQTATSLAVSEDETDCE